MLVALEWAVRAREERWTQAHEIAAVNAELVHSLLLTTLKVNGAKNVGKPIHIPRPWDKKTAAAEVMSIRDFARAQMGVGNG